MNHKELIEHFYSAFARGDGEAMAKCYHSDARFSDPGFPNLRGKEVGAMWRMLTSRAKDLRIEHSDVSAIGDRGEAKWIARYTFSQTKRQVINHIQASFVFKDGLILEHADHFDFWRWARQAIGLPGLLFGWSGTFRRKVQNTTRGALMQFMQKHPE
jgi:ketosteroid isomerase-like protein